MCGLLRGERFVIQIHKFRIQKEMYTISKRFIWYRAQVLRIKVSANAEWL